MPKPGPGATLRAGNPFANGLKGAWLCNEGTGIAGDQIKDHSGNEHHGIIEHGGATPPSSYWIDLDPAHDPAFIVTPPGISTWFRVPDHADFDFVGDFTIIIGYAASPAALAVNDVLAGKASSDAWNDGWTIYTSASSKVKFGFVGSAFADAAVDPTSDPVYSTSTYHQVVLRFDSVNSDLFGYVDGVQVASELTQSAHVTTSVDMYFGRQANIFTRPWDGFIFYAYVYNRLLSTTEIASLYADPYQMWEPPGTLLAPAMEESLQNFPDLAHPVLELTLGGTKYKYAEEPIFSASAGQYQGYLVSIGDLTRRIDFENFGLEVPEFEAVVFDHDRDLQELMGGPLRGAIRESLAETWWRTADLNVDPSEHYRDFTGVVHSYAGAGDRKYKFRFRPDMSKLEGPAQIPRFSTAHFPLAPERSHGQPLQIVYGRHFSTQISDSFGMIECLPAEKLGNGNVDLWLASYGALKRVPRIFIGEVLSTSSFSIFTQQSGSALYQMIKYTAGDPHPNEDSVVRIDAEGLMTFPLTGTTILNPVEQIRHFLATFVYSAGDVRAAAAWPSEDGLPISTRLFNDAEASFRVRRAEGAMIVYSDEKAIDVLNRWCKSNKAAPFFDDTMELGVAAREQASTGIYFDSKHVAQKLNHALDELSFSTIRKAPPTDITVRHLFDEARGKFVKTGSVALRREGVPILTEADDQEFALRWDERASSF